MNLPHQMPLAPEIWASLATHHLATVGPFADAFIKRRSLNQTHPVHDFLFTYYQCSPAKLKQWVPSIDQSLILSPNSLKECPWLSNYWCHINGDILQLNPKRLQDNTRSLAQFVVDLCQNITNKAPRFGCYGLHEWAMVYKQSQETIRHSGHALRLSPETLAQFVESQKICCSHYDAYRFFTKEAQPLNTLNPTIDTRLQMEQSGCLHANMDLYKWATKLWPWVGSTLVAETFMLALRGRELDMRASPYDLSSDGYSPICIETEEGRSQYQIEQIAYQKWSIPLRNKLKAACERIVNL